jgi:predicted lipoprotein with Yx(FWY)xxD motif
MTRSTGGKATPSTSGKAIPSRGGRAIPSTSEEGPGRPASLAVVLVAVIAAVAVAAFAGLAFAKGPTTLRTSDVGGRTIVVNSKGRTVYVLKPETSRHLLCKSSSCLQFWPPVKVSKNGKLRAAAGIKGKLGRLHRKGFYQLTLGGEPLYMYSGDSGKGMANGDGIRSFGGTWHVLSLGKSHAAGTTTMSTTTTTTSNPTTSTTTTTNPYHWA